MIVKQYNSLYSTIPPKKLFEICNKRIYKNIHLYGKITMNVIVLNYGNATRETCTRRLVCFGFAQRQQHP